MTRLGDARRDCGHEPAQRREQPWPRRVRALLRPPRSAGWSTRRA